MSALSLNPTHLQQLQTEIDELNNAIDFDLSSISTFSTNAEKYASEQGPRAIKVVQLQATVNELLLSSSPITLSASKLCSRMARYTTLPLLAIKVVCCAKMLILGNGCLLTSEKNHVEETINELIHSKDLIYLPPKFSTSVQIMEQAISLALIHSPLEIPVSAKEIQFIELVEPMRELVGLQPTPRTVFRKVTELTQQVDALNEAICGEIAEMAQPGNGIILKKLLLQYNKEFEERNKKTTAYRNEFAQLLTELGQNVGHSTKLAAKLGMLSVRMSSYEHLPHAAVKIAYYTNLVQDGTPTIDEKRNIRQGLDKCENVKYCLSEKWVRAHDILTKVISLIILRDELNPEFSDEKLAEQLRLLDANHFNVEVKSLAS